jgi:hypothetical protein
MSKSIYMISYCGHSPNLYTNQDILNMSYLFTKKAYWNLEDNVCCCDGNGHSIGLKYIYICSCYYIQQRNSLKIESCCSNNYVAMVDVQKPPQCKNELKCFDINVK